MNCQSSISLNAFFVIFIEYDGYYAIQDNIKYTSLLKSIFLMFRCDGYDRFGSGSTSCKNPYEQAIVLNSIELGQDSNY